MPEHVSILQQAGAAVLAGATVVWAVGLVRLLRSSRRGAVTLNAAQALRAMPRQTMPAAESVELTPAERDAFAHLVRQFGRGRR